MISLLLLTVIRSALASASPSMNLRQFVEIHGVRCTLSVSSVDSFYGARGGSLNLIDGDLSTPWRPAVSDTKPSLEFRFEKPIQIRQLAIASGLRERLTDLMIASPYVKVDLDGKWIGTAPSYKELAYIGAWQRWDSLHPFKWDGAKGELGEMWVDQTRRSGRVFRFAIYPASSSNYVGARSRNFAISEIVLANSDKRPDLLLPPIISAASGKIDSRFFLNEIIRIQDFHRYAFWVKNEISDYGLEGDPPLPPKPIFFFRKSASDSSDFKIFINHIRRSQNETKGFWFRPGPDSSWTATYPLVSWGQNYGAESHPVIEGKGSEIVALKSTDGVLPQDPPQIHYLNSREQTMKIDEPVHVADTSSVTIGNQIWMKSNLSKSKRDSGSICWGLSVEDSGKWNRNCAEFGRLYRSEDANQICPDGWHMPSIYDWQELFRFVDSSLQKQYSPHQLWFFLMAPGKWHSGEPGMDPFKFSANYYTRPPIGPWLHPNRSPTFLAAHPKGCIDRSYSEGDRCEQVIDLERFPREYLDSNGFVRPNFKLLSMFDVVKPDYAPARCIRDKRE
ncbi:MAG: hypothetical protein IPN71_06210 [Fibrobacteres bacterium]|nr:hypothetical protein [Fibrobacterota bacterium]